MESVKPETTHERTVSRNCFDPYAPPSDLPFPTGARMTAFELLAFLPYSIQCPQAVYRFVSNGASRGAVWAIVNTARDFQKEWKIARCGTAITKTMTEAGYTGWTLKGHDLWHMDGKNDWDGTNLDVTEFVAPGQAYGEEGSGASIAFKDLAVAVRRWPQGHEALDLTRMVVYAMQHPDQQLIYPQDYDKLLTLVGGPAMIVQGNLDRQIFQWWDRKQPAQPRVWSIHEEDKARELVEAKRKAKQAGDVPTATGERRGRGRPRTRLESEHTPEHNRETYVRSENTPEGAKETDVEYYPRGSAQYVEVPTDVIPPSHAAILRAFSDERNLDQTGMYSAYAFDGPRHQPPFPMLHDIELPDQNDVSGWAENLRWAFEQRACFSYMIQTRKWNESPAHMEFIAKTRMEQMWVSDELLEGEERQRTQDKERAEEEKQWYNDIVKDFD